MKRTYIMPAAKFRVIKINNILITSPTDDGIKAGSSTENPADGNPGEGAAAKNGWGVVDFGR